MEVGLFNIRILLKQNLMIIIIIIYYYCIVIWVIMFQTLNKKICKTHFENCAKKVF